MGSAPHLRLVEDRPERRFGPLQFFLFQVSFASLEFFALARVYLLYRRSQDVRARRIFQLGVGAYALAIALWLSDIQFCTTLGETLPAYGIPNPQLHAWWHVLVSCGFYALLMVIAHDRLKTLGQVPRVHFAAGVIPFVRTAAPPRDVREPRCPHHQLGEPS